MPVHRVTRCPFDNLASLTGSRAEEAPCGFAPLSHIISSMRYVLPFLLLLTTPVLAATPQARKQAEINQVLDALKAAPNEEAAGVLEDHLTEMWVNAGTPAVTLLMSRGLRELKAGDNKDAIEDFNDAVTLQPELAEGYRQLAMARYAAGDTQGAIEDLALAVQHEPRDFLAYRTLTDIFESQQNWKGAYDAWQKVLAIDPKTPGAQERLKHLQQAAFGQEA
jgi:tetratricopeptide (TPR) repeat protein